MLGWHKVKVVTKMNDELDIIAVGESLVEFSANESLLYANSLDKFYGGDAICTAIAATRLGSKVGYISRVGNDNFKDYLLDSWQSEGLDISQVKLVEGTNGLYVMTRAENGEREFVYYRKKTAGCCLAVEDISEDYLKKSRVFYSTGVLQALSLSAKEAIKVAYENAKKHNLITAYKPNFLPKLLSVEEAKENFDDVAQNVDILFLSIKKDAKNLFEIETMDNLIKHFWDLGIGTIVVKVSDQKCYYTGFNGDVQRTDFYTDQVVDTTCSGDAFAGAFLHGIVHGMGQMEATRLAAIVEGLQAQKIGAIKSIPTKEEVMNIFKGANG